MAAALLRPGMTPPLPNRHPALATPGAAAPLASRPGACYGVATPLHASALLALAQLAGIHAAAEACAELPPLLLLETRVAHSCKWLPESEELFDRINFAAARNSGERSARRRLTTRTGLLFVKRGATANEMVGHPNLGQCGAQHTGWLCA
jgi:hypothetical protein